MCTCAILDNLLDKSHKISQFSHNLVSRYSVSTKCVEKNKRGLKSVSNLLAILEVVWAGHQGPSRVRQVRHLRGKFKEAFTLWANPCRTLEVVPP